MIRAALWFLFAGALIALVVQDQAKFRRANAPPKVEVEFDPSPHLLAGRTTIIQFHSERCGPCVDLGRRLEGLRSRRRDLLVVKIDIDRRGVQGIDWNSPIAQQVGLQSLPYLRIYDDRGQMLADGREARRMVDAWISQ